MPARIARRARRSRPPPRGDGSVSGSPRRARTSASTSSACRRGSGESRDLGDDQLRGRGRIRPRAAVELEPDAKGEKGESPEVELEAVAVREPRLDPARRLTRASRARPTRARGCAWHERPAAEAALRAPRRASARAAERSPVRNSSTVASPIERVDALLGVAEPARELHRSLPPRDHGLVVATVGRDKRPSRRSHRRATGSPAARSSTAIELGGGLLGLGEEASARQIGHEPAPGGGLPIDARPLDGAARSPARARRSRRPGRR